MRENKTRGTAYLFSLEFLLLATLGAFFLLTPYFGNAFVKGCLYGCIVWTILLLVFRRGKDFYKGFIPKNILNRYVAIFGIALVISVCFSKDPYVSQKLLFSRYFLFFGFFLCGVWAASVRQKNTLFFIGGMFLAAALVFAAGGVIDYWRFWKALAQISERLWSVFGKRIEYYAFPLYISFFMPFVFSLVVGAKRRALRVIACAVFVLLLLCLAWNGSRMAVSAVFVSMLALVVINIRRHVKLIIILFSAFLLTLAVASMNSSVIRWRMKTIATPSEWSNRLPLYHSALKMFADHPVKGVGLGMYGQFLEQPRYALPKDYPVPMIWNLHAHNVYLEIMAEMGLVGILPFLALIVVFFVQVVRTLPRIIHEDEKAVYAGFAASVLSVLLFASGASIITVGLTVSGYFWVLIGVVTGLSERIKKG